MTWNCPHVYFKSLFYLEQPFENERPQYFCMYMEIGFIYEEKQIIKILLHDTEGQEHTQDASKSEKGAELEIKTKPKTLQAQTYGP